MIFKRILINNFGGLREKDIELTSGVNVLYGLKETEHCVYLCEEHVLWSA